MMDKIQIKGLVQGRKKLKDGSFAVGVRTLYGVAWITSSNWHKFAVSNKHLIKSIEEDGSIIEEKWKDRFINVTNKAERSEYLGQIIVSPRL
jgi:hypothetical protein